MPFSDAIVPLKHAQNRVPLCEDHVAAQTLLGQVKSANPGFLEVSKSVFCFWLVTKPNKQLFAGDPHLQALSAGDEDAWELM